MIILICMYKLMLTKFCLLNAVTFPCFQVNVRASVAFSAAHKTPDKLIPKHNFNLIKKISYIVLYVIGQIRGG